jgi:hypothetical protein
VDLQDPHSWLGNSFDRDNIDRSFTRGGKPEWKRAEDPWRFYDPDEIRRHQLRWLNEARKQQAQRYGLDDREPAETYRRAQPKIGHNAPCPCGSGKNTKSAACKNCTDLQYGDWRPACSCSFSVSIRHPGVAGGNRGQSGERPQAMSIDHFHECFQLPVAAVRAFILCKSID